MTMLTRWARRSAMFVCLFVATSAMAAEPELVQKDAIVLKKTASKDEQGKWFTLKKGDQVHIVYQRGKLYWVRSSKGQQAWIKKSVFQLADGTTSDDASTPAQSAAVVERTESSTEDGATDTVSEASPIVELSSTGTEKTPTQTTPAAVSASNSAEPKDIELRIRKMSDVLALSAKNLPQDARYLRFAVMPFDATSPEAKENGLGLVISDIVASTLRRDHRLALVERARVNAILQEQAFQQMGVTDPKDAAEIGKLANADVLVIGQVALLGANYHVTSKMIDVATANVVGSSETTIAAADLVALSADSVVLRSKADAMFRSLAFPGWGQHYNKEATKGWIFTGVTGALLATGVGFELGGLFTHLFYYVPYKPEDDGFASSGDPEFRRNLEDRFNLAATQFTVGHVVLGVTAAVWAYNAFDAYVSGIDGETAESGAAGD